MANGGSAKDFQAVAPTSSKVLVRTAGALAQVCQGAKPEWAPRLVFLRVGCTEVNGLPDVLCNLVAALKQVRWGPGWRGGKTTLCRDLGPFSRGRYLPPGQ